MFEVDYFGDSYTPHTKIIVYVDFGSEARTLFRQNPEIKDLCASTNSIDICGDTFLNPFNSHSLER